VIRSDIDGNVSVPYRSCYENAKTLRYYRILKAADLITAPAYVVIKAADELRHKTTAINEMWQTDFTYFKIIGRGWYGNPPILNGAPQ